MEKDRLYMNEIITITTDFGLKDHYSGALKGAILSVNPQARIVDIAHLIAPGAISEGAFVLAHSCRYFPRGTVHLAVVDPGVGSSRRPILIETEDYCFVGPDNGIFSRAIESEKILRVIHLTDGSYFRKDVSATFHGRDIFGPVAGHLTLGVSPSMFGPEITDPVIIGRKTPLLKDGVVAGTVIYVDRYGNLVTDIRAESIADLGPQVETSIKGHLIRGVKRSYSYCEGKTPALIIGSTGLLEIAIDSEDASQALGVATGERVVVRQASLDGGAEKQGGL